MRATDLFSAGGIVAEAFTARDSVFDALVAALDDGSTSPRADDLARRLGLRNRFQLAYRLNKLGLPTVLDLKGIVRVVRWVHRWQAEGVSLAEQALSVAKDPTGFYKTVRRVTGCAWLDVRDLPVGEGAGKAVASFSWGGLENLRRRCVGRSPLHACVYELREPVRGEWLRLSPPRFRQESKRFLLRA